MLKLRILVNFETKKIVHTPEPIGSDHYKALISSGYTKVGEMKTNEPPKIFWEEAYFEYKAKYVYPKVDSITT